MRIKLVKIPILQHKKKTLFHPSTLESNSICHNRRETSTNCVCCVWCERENFRSEWKSREKKYFPTFSEPAKTRYFSLSLSPRKPERVCEDFPFGSVKKKEKSGKSPLEEKKAKWEWREEIKRAKCEFKPELFFECLWNDPSKNKVANSSRNWERRKVFDVI